VLLAACDDPKKTAPTAAPSVAASPSPTPTPPPPPPKPSASAEETKPDEGAVPPLADITGKPLPQTEEKPSLRSKSWEKRVKLLFRAIQTDDPKVAMPAFFPVIAYEQVKAIPKPAADWQARLVTAFERDIHAAHKEMGNGAMSATLVGLEVPEEKAKWMPPGGEGNKLGYYRVLGSKLRYLDGGGGAKAVDVTSLISWRGEWYVVHLKGFK
jgi:hypothetical protein